MKLDNFNYILHCLNILFCVLKYVFDITHFTNIRYIILFRFSNIRLVFF